MLRVYICTPLGVWMVLREGTCSYFHTWCTVNGVRHT